MLRTFTELAAAPDPRLDQLALAVAAEFREVDFAGAMQQLDALGSELSESLSGRDPASETAAIAEVLGGRHGFAGDRRDYDHPDNSMLDLVLERRRGLPIVLSVIYVEVGRRAGVPMLGVGLPGHFVAGHFGAVPPLLLDPFAGGAPVEADAGLPPVRPWDAREIALRMLNNLTAAYRRRGDLAAALRAAEMRESLPADPRLRDTLEIELRAMRAQLN